MTKTQEKPSKTNLQTLKVDSLLCSEMLMSTAFCRVAMFNNSSLNSMNMILILALVSKSLQGGCNYQLEESH